METAKDQFRPKGTSTEVSVQEKAFLVHGTQKIPIYAECASKYSLTFKYLADQQLNSSDEPINLLLHDNGQSVEVGPCRILSNPSLNGVSGRLVFINEIYDIHRLLQEKKAVELQSAFHDLPLIFARKETIHSSFKEYTADLAYDLSVYKKIFDNLDSQYREEPEDVRRSIQNAIIETEGKKFNEFFHKKVEALGEIVGSYNLKEHQQHGFYFRKQLWNFIICCALMVRTNLKPRGYAGDSEMMKMIYLNDYNGETTFCKLMQKYTIGVTASQSVRNRRKLITELLNELQKTNHFGVSDKFRVLSVACGPAFEIADILVKPSDFKKYDFTLLDQDPIALNEAAQFISKVENRCGKKIQVAYKNLSVRLMFRNKLIERDLGGKFHFIYSMGLFDYLSAPVAKAIIEKLYKLLNFGGEIIIGNFHVSNPSKFFMEYWGDWYLIHRTEEDLKELVKDIPSASSSIIFEETGSQMFLKIKKQEGAI